MSSKLYQYVGPEEIRCRSATGPGGRVIESPEALRMWLNGHRPSEAGGLVAATFVIDPDGWLRLADRRSEHVACAGGGRVLSAGEMFFSDRGDAAVVEEVTNLSTGYCPEPESWPVVGNALDRLGVVHPGRFTTEVIFRLCPGCGERSVVKDAWFECQVCGGELPRVWNFGTGEPAMPISNGFHGSFGSWIEKLPTPEGKPFVVAYEHGTLSIEMYAPRGVDTQTPHHRDEVYVVVRGEGSFVNGPDRHRFGPGDLLFVPAGVEHRFEEFSDDLAVWVIFYGPDGGEQEEAGR